ncbi:MAG: hypothetical protein AAB421_04710 [Patescibacteria group bacterium]|mgnify:CR=1 FL=1
MAKESWAKALRAFRKGVDPADPLSAPTSSSPDPAVVPPDTALPSSTSASAPDTTIVQKPLQPEAELDAIAKDLSPETVRDYLQDIAGDMAQLETKGGGKSDWQAMVTDITKELDVVNDDIQALDDAAAKIPAPLAPTDPSYSPVISPEAKRIADLRTSATDLAATLERLQNEAIEARDKAPDAPLAPITSTTALGAGTAAQTPGAVPQAPATISAPPANHLGDFSSEALETVDGSSVPVGTLYDQYSDWATAKGWQPVPREEFEKGVNFPSAKVGGRQRFMGAQVKAGFNPASSPAVSISAQGSTPASSGPGVTIGIPASAPASTGPAVMINRIPTTPGPTPTPITINVRGAPTGTGEAFMRNQDWEKQLQDMEAMPTPLALDGTAKSAPLPGQPVAGAPVVVSVAGAISERAYAGALARFKDPQFVKALGDKLADDVKGGQKGLKRIQATVTGLNKSLGKLSPDVCTARYEEFAQAMVEGKGLTELLAKGNEYAVAASALAADDLVGGLGELSEAIADTKFPDSPDIYAREKAPVAGAIQKSVRGVMGLDIAFALIAASTGFSGGQKTAGALVAKLPDTVRASILQMLENPLFSGGQTLEMILKGMVGAAAFVIARGIVTGKDTMRDMAVQRPGENALAAAFRNDPSAMTRAVMATLVAATFAGHGFNYAIVGAQVMSTYATEALSTLAPEFASIETARQTVAAVPGNIDAFFRAYISAEKNGVAKIATELTAEQQALVKQMGWTFSPTAAGDGPITAAKRYALFRAVTPKLRPADKAAIDAKLAEFGVPEGQGFAQFASALATVRLGTTTKSLDATKGSLEAQIASLSTTGPVAHFLYELFPPTAQSGQEVPNLLTTLASSKAAFAASYKTFTTETWNTEVQQRFGDLMASFGSRADNLDMKFGAIALGASKIPAPPVISAVPFLYSDAEYAILGKALGVDLTDTGRRSLWNGSIALLYGLTDVATVYPSIRYTRRRQQYLREKMPGYRKAMEESEDDLAEMLEQYVNNNVNASARIIAGVDLTPISLATIRTRLHEKACSEVTALKAKEQLAGIRNLPTRTLLSWRRILQMPLGEDVEERLAYQDWIEAEIEKIKKDPAYLATLLSDIEPGFKPLFTLAQTINKDPRKIGEMSAEYTQGVRKQIDALNRRVMRAERTALMTETALYDQLLRRVYAQPFTNETLKQFSENPIAIPMDGKSEVAITNNEVAFYVASEIERRRRHALNRLVAIARKEESVARKDWAVNAGNPAYTEAFRGTTSVQPQGLLDRARAEIGDADANMIADIESEVRRALFGREAIDPDRLSAQMTLVNQTAVAFINQTANAAGPENPLRRSTKSYEAVTAYEHEDPYGRPILQVHLYDPGTQAPAATILYPGYLPFVAEKPEDDAKMTELLSTHIAEWYQNAAQYELSAHALTYETGLAIRDTTDQIKAMGATKWPDMRVPIAGKSDVVTPEATTLFARLNLLNELFERRTRALGAITRTTPITPQQLIAFAEEQLVVIGGSTVPETATRIATVLNGIRTELNTRGRNDAVTYDALTGVVRVGAQETPVQSIATPRDFVESLA